MLYTPEQELDDRISRLQALMQERRVNGALIIQQADLFYFSGTAQNAHLYIPAEGEPVLLVKKSLARAREESALVKILPLGGLKQLADQLAGEGYPAPGILGLEMDVLPANNFLFYRQIFAGSEIVDISPLTRQVRQVKSPYEIERLRVSAQKMDAVFRRIPGFIREGMTEVELAARIEGAARAGGHMGLPRLRAFNQSIFMGNLMSGAAAAIPSGFDGPTGGPGLTPAQPSGAGYKKIGREEPIFVDFAGIWDGYIIDQTRIYSIGPLPKKFTDAHQVALEIQETVVRHCKPGVSGSELHELALRLAEAAGLAEYFMGFGPDRARFVGHGVGLELDELPVLASGLNVELAPGMVFALEPKFVFPGEGVVGTENTFAVTETGVERLTPAPDEIIIVK